jgi:hypothetical protein
MNDNNLLTKRTKDLFRIWNRDRNKKVFGIIDTIAIDCLAQSECLQENQDVKWDVYDHDNWDNMVEQLDKIKLILMRGD